VALSQKSIEFGSVSHVIIKRLLGKLDNRIGDYAVEPLGSGD
jgi:hypothetical protein